MSYQFYKIVHITSIFMLFLSLGGIILANGTLAKGWRRLAAITHGIGTLGAVVSGFGLIARLGLHGFPIWIYFKLGIWIVFAGAISVALRKPELSRLYWFGLIVLGLLAATIAIYKPS